MTFYRAVFLVVFVMTGPAPKAPAGAGDIERPGRCEVHIPVQIMPAIN